MQILSKPVKATLSILYFTILGYLVFFAKRRRHRIIRSIYLVPFKSTISQYHEFAHMNPFKFYTDLLGNLIIFVPVAFIFRFFFPQSKNGQVILFGFLLSFSIEVLQYIFEVGYSEVDDLIVNTLGTAVGLLLYNYMVSVYRKV